MVSMTDGAVRKSISATKAPMQSGNLFHLTPRMPEKSSTVRSS
jgi:hypothetical protein